MAMSNNFVSHNLNVSPNSACPTSIFTLTSPEFLRRIQMERLVFRPNPTSKTEWKITLFTKEEHYKGKFQKCVFYSLKMVSCKEVEEEKQKATYTVSIVAEDNTFSHTKKSAICDYTIENTGKDALLIPLNELEDNPWILPNGTLTVEVEIAFLNAISNISILPEKEDVNNDEKDGVKVPVLPLEVSIPFIKSETKESDHEDFQVSAQSTPSYEHWEINKNIELEGGFNVEIVDAMITFMLTGRISELTFDIAFGCYLLSRRYQLDKLTNICRDFLKNNIKPYNFCLIVRAVEAYDDSELQNAVTKIIFENYAASLSIKQWAQRCRENNQTDTSMLTDFNRWNFICAGPCHSQNYDRIIQ